MTDRDWLNDVRDIYLKLNQWNGCDVPEQTLRILKIGEEFGEAAEAWISVTGQNPRKIGRFDMDDVSKELCDVAITAMTALGSIIGIAEAKSALEDRAREIATRLRKASDASS
jgi:NTP pyrophosphatase (non-canonical NTP hydrolase)